jgi:NitT/TauT family transport system substrate-binding protein
MLAGVTAAAMVALSLSGCAGLFADPDAEGLEEVTIAVEPLIGSAAVYLGVREGYFREGGIDLIVNSFPSTGDDVVDMVAAGHADFGLADTLTLMVNQAAGVDIDVISGAYATTGNVDSDFAALVVKQDSKIQTVSDIQGKNVSSPDPRSLDETVVRGLIEDDGGNPAGVHFIKVPQSGVIEALENDVVDVAFVIEPYLSWAKEAGHRVLNYPYAQYSKTLSVAAYFTTKDVSSTKPDLSHAFNVALKKSLKYAQEHPDEVRAVFSTYTTTADSTRTSLSLPRYSERVDKVTLGRLGHVAVNNGILAKDPDIAALLP